MSHLCPLTIIQQDLNAARASCHGRSMQRGEAFHVVRVIRIRFELGPQQPLGNFFTAQTTYQVKQGEPGQGVGVNGIERRAVIRYDQLFE